MQKIIVKKHLLKVVFESKEQAEKAEPIILYELHVKHIRLGSALVIFDSVEVGQLFELEANGGSLYDNEVTDYDVSAFECTFWDIA